MSDWGGSHGGSDGAGLHSSGALLAWLIGTRVTFGWDEVERQRESDVAALQVFYQSYGKFFAAWKAWAVYVRNVPPDGRGFPVSGPRAWEILKTAGEAESGFESILVKLASEYAHSAGDRALFASFRQGGQALREAIRDGRDLTWKAQPTSPRDRGRSNPRRGLEYRQYRAFKALSEHVATTLAAGPYGSRTRSGGRARLLLLGIHAARRTDQTDAIAALIAITETQGIGGRWWIIAEEAFSLPDPPGSLT